MVYYQEELKTEQDRILESLERMRNFTGSPNEFWPAFMEGAVNLATARVGILMVRAVEDEAWKNFCIWPKGGQRGLNKENLKERLEEVADHSAEMGYACDEGIGPNKTDGYIILGVRLDIQEEDNVCVAIFFLGKGHEPPLEEITTRLKLVAGIPAVYLMRRIANQAKSDVIQFAEAMDLMVLLNAEQKYLAAAMTLCNELASRYGCERVSLGWLTGAYIRVQVISHMERFEKKMEAVQKLEAAMEEAFDQDEEVLWPRPEGSNSVTRDHEAFAREQGTDFMVSLPIRLDDAPAGILTCERSSGPFTEEDVRGLRVFCDQAARRLGDLRKHDRWFGARIAASIKESLGKLIGVEHTFAKLMGILIALALAVLIFGKMNYRVEAPFILMTDDVAFLPAPFDGYIDEVHTKIGDLVEKDAALLSLDTSELLLEESTALANENRYMREAEKARAQNALADMRIATALEAQARAQLKLVRYHIENARLRAPFSGIVVEGDLDELLGSPVRKGDILFKVARIENMYAELKVEERDIHEVVDSATGEIAFISRPNLKFSIHIERIEPVAVPEEEGNIFLVRAIFPEDIERWWRPGMSGLAKINVGKRNILWIITHRTIDFIRIFLWW